MIFRLARGLSGDGRGGRDLFTLVIARLSLPFSPECLILGMANFVSGFASIAAQAVSVKTDQRR